MAAEVKPWPTWVRYPLIAVLAIVVIIGLVLALTNGVDNAVWRIVIAAVLIPAVLLPVQLWGRRRRAERRAGPRHDHGAP
jgi:predicted lysophospholipase L1 biosynthesis ABC-type transport system permease subunit